MYKVLIFIFVFVFVWYEGSVLIMEVIYIRILFEIMWDLVFFFRNFIIDMIMRRVEDYIL